MKTSMIISTYNEPEGLRKTLLGLLSQTTQAFDVVVADDGSGPQTADVIAESRFAELSVRHVWHADTGFRLSAIRNRAIASSDAEYLIFCDGDSICLDHPMIYAICRGNPQWLPGSLREDIFQKTLHKRPVQPLEIHHDQLTIDPWSVSQNKKQDNLSIAQ